MKDWETVTDFTVLRAMIHRWPSCYVDPAAESIGDLKAGMVRFNEWYYTTNPTVAEVYREGTLTWHGIQQRKAALCKYYSKAPASLATTMLD